MTPIYDVDRQAITRPPLDMRPHHDNDHYRWLSASITPISPAAYIKRSPLSLVRWPCTLCSVALQVFTSGMGEGPHESNYTKTQVQYIAEYSLNRY